MTDTPTNEELAERLDIIASVYAPEFRGNVQAELREAARRLRAAHTEGPEDWVKQVFTPLPEEEALALREVMDDPAGDEQAAQMDALAEERLSSAERAEAEVARLRKQCQWRPIETAPKDAAVLLYSSCAYEIGHFNTVLQIWAACWDHRRLTQVTHWQPLPAPPDTEEPRGG